MAREKSSRGSMTRALGAASPHHPLSRGKTFLGMSVPGFRFTVWLSHATWGNPWQPLINSTSTFGAHNQPTSRYGGSPRGRIPGTLPEPQFVRLCPMCQAVPELPPPQREPLDFCNRYLGLNSLDTKSWCAVAWQCLWGPFHLRSSRGYQNEGHR